MTWEIMPVLALLFVVAPVVEALVAVQVARRVGWWAVLLWMIVAALVGAVLIRRQGVAVWRGVRGRLRAGKLPSSETADHLLLLVGALLILLPGFISDLAGVALLFAPVRAAVRRWALRRWWPARISGRPGVVDVKVAREDPPPPPRQIGS